MPNDCAQQREMPSEVVTETRITKQKKRPFEFAPIQVKKVFLSDSGQAESDHSDLPEIILKSKTRKKPKQQAETKVIILREISIQTEEPSCN